MQQQKPQNLCPAASITYMVEPVVLSVWFPRQDGLIQFQPPFKCGLN